MHTGAGARGCGGPTGIYVHAPQGPHSATACPHRGWVCAVFPPWVAAQPHASVMVAVWLERGVCRTLTRSPCVKMREIPYLCPMSSLARKQECWAAGPLHPGLTLSGSWVLLHSDRAWPPPPGSGVHSDGWLWVRGLETGLPALRPSPSHLSLPMSWAAPRGRSRKFHSQLPWAT